MEVGCGQGGKANELEAVYCRFVPMNVGIREWHYIVINICLWHVITITGARMNERAYYGFVGIYSCWMDIFIWSLFQERDYIAESEIVWMHICLTLDRFKDA